MSPPRIFAALVSGHLAKHTKEFLLNSPTFVRFAQESSKKGQEVLNEAMKAAQPTIEKVSRQGEKTLRDLERKAKK
eukprot:CAMPEP_0197654202 /NCGR_PEP_ID=MMETSP1338-20131121/38713_1 /TAXON_ID=43686 ORGANISM="Pelagodinium beii, Strain RCC1491" /NCGR_SAMPLE_ID=MMETSP1338 /ASSEMBLY_ACC=CAM_ASM_000754 /LENGTH=75 /DNA_ID=CAMNT_0043229603 /DNA_START=85 /DNA_END=312 /DNA_ORIENTATION=+